MSSNREVKSASSHNKAEWVKWPHPETHWQPQHVETPHRAMKKSDNLRSHSWWWDSHISPKSSKWLQDNLSEMDSKVNAMLKIIEEDADSFAKRAEMYYKRRPELVNLVEDFYRTYRALVERYTFLTKEIRQNIAPALQAQLGASFDSPQNSPIDLNTKHGMDGFDLTTISSYSYTGALEFDDDSQSEISTKSWKGHVDEEDSSPQGSRLNFETQAFEFKPTVSSSEEENLHNSHQSRELHGTIEAESSHELKKALERLEDENKVLAAKSSEDATNFKDLKLEICSLQSKSRALEAEDKLAKDRLKSLLQQTQKLEAENLKLNHTLITTKEEKTQLIELRDKGVQDRNASNEKIRQLEEELAVLKQEMSASQSQVLVGLEQAKKCEDKCLKLQHNLAMVQEENQRDAIALTDTFELRMQELLKQIVHFEEENVALKEQIATGTEKIEDLNNQIMDLDDIKKGLQQALLNSQKQNEALELESSAAVLNIQELQREREVAERDNQELSEQMVQRDGQVLKLEETIGNLEAQRTRLEVEKNGMSKAVLILEANLQELQRARDNLLAESQHQEVKCKSLEAAKTQLEEQLALKLRENNCLQDEKSAIEGRVAKADLEVKELHQSLSVSSSEKMVLLHDLEKALDEIKIVESQGLQLKKKAAEIQGENDRLTQDSVAQISHIKDLEDTLSRLLQKKDMLEHKEAKALQTISELEKASQAESAKLKQTLEGQFAHIGELESSLSKLLKEKDMLEKRETEALQVISELQKQLSQLEREKVAGSKHVLKLGADNEELQKARDDLITECQHLEVECKALKAAEAELKAQLAVKLTEGAHLQNDKSALEAIVAKVHLQVEELQENLSALSSEKAMLKHELEEASERVRITNTNGLQMQKKAEESQAERAKLSQELEAQMARVVELEGMMSSLLHGKDVLEKREIQAQKTISEFGKENSKLGQELKLKDALTNSLKEKIMDLENERNKLALDIEQTGQRLVELQGENATLSSQYTKSQADYHTMEEEARTARVDITCQLSEIEKLQGEATANVELMGKFESETNSLRRQLTKFEEEFNNLGKEKENCTKMLADYETRLHDLEPRVSDLLVVNAALNEQVSEKSKGIENLEAELLDVCKEKETLRDEIASRTGNSILLQKQLDESKELEESHRVDLQKSLDRIQSLEMEVENLQLSISKAEECNIALVHEQQKSLDESLCMKKRIQDLEEKIGHLTEDKVLLVKDIEEQKRSLQLELQNSTDMTRSLEAEVVKLHQAVFTAEEKSSIHNYEHQRSLDESIFMPKKIKDIHEKLGSLLEEKKFLVSKVGTYREQRDEMETRIMSLESGTDAVQKELSQAISLVKHLEEEVNNLHGENEQLIMSLGVESTKLKNQEDHLEKMQEALNWSLVEKATVIDQMKLVAEEKDDLLKEHTVLQEELKESQRAASVARNSIEKLEDDLSQLRQANAVVENGLSSKCKELSSVKVDASRLLERKNQLEEEARVGIDQIRSLNEDAERLRQHLIDVQHENKRLEQLSLQLATNHADAERATVVVREELDKQMASNESLKLDMAAELTKMRKLEQDLIELQEEKKKLYKKLEAMQQEMRAVQGEQEHLLLKLKTTTLQLGEKELEFESLQEQLKFAESHSSSLTENLSKIKTDWGAEKDRLQEELAQLNASYLEGQKELALQLGFVRKMEDELGRLHGEKLALQEDRDLGANQLADMQRKIVEKHDQIEELRKRQQEKDEESLELLAKAESLKQSLLARELENANLIENLNKCTDCQNAAEKKFMDELSHLQNEEMKWKCEVTAKSALIAKLQEKIASLGMENAALNEDLSLKIELGLKLQKEVKSLTEESRGLSQKLETGAAEMLQLKNDLQLLKEFEMHSLEDRLIELQNEKTDLAMSHQRNVAENASLGKQVKDVTSKLLIVHEENAMLKIELIFHAEMLKDVEGVFSAGKTENIKILGRLALQEKQSQMLEQSLIKATEENQDLNRRVLSSTEEGDELKREIQNLIAISAEVEQLQRELAVAREENFSLREMVSAGAASVLKLQTEVSSLQTNNRGLEDARESLNTQMHEMQLAVKDMENKKDTLLLELQQQSRDSLSRMSGIQDLYHVVKGEGSGLVAAKESTDENVEAISPHVQLLVGLRKEFLFLQEKIQRLESAIQVQVLGSTSNEVDAREFKSVVCEDLPGMQHESTSSTSSMTTVERAVSDSYTWKDVLFRMDGIQRLKEENHTLAEENDLLKSQSLAAWMEHNLIENSLKELQGNLSHLQEVNGQLSLEVSSCKTDISRLEEECQVLKGRSRGLQEEVDAAAVEVRKSQDTRIKLEELIATLKETNRSLNEGNEIANVELNQLQGIISSLQKEGIQSTMLLKSKMLSLLEGVKLMIDECWKEIEDEGIMQAMRSIEHLCSLRYVHASASVPVVDTILGIENDVSQQGEERSFTETINRRGTEKVMSELEARNMRVLAELQARVEEANLLLEVVEFVRKMLDRFWCGEHSRQKDPLPGTTDMLQKKEEAGEVIETAASEDGEELEPRVGSVLLHINLGARLHQASMDEKLEHELLELKEGRKQLKEDLEARLEDLHTMEAELEKLQRLLQEDGGKQQHDAREEEKKKAEERGNELREKLVLQRQQIGRMQEEVMSWEEQQEAAAESQVVVLVSKESDPSMEGWDDEQVKLLSREMDSLKALNRRHSVELQAISEDLQSMESVIKSTQERLLLRSHDGEDPREAEDIVDLNTQNRKVAVDLFSGSTKVSPGPAENAAAAPRSSSSQFHLKPRGFGFNWFLLLFSPDKKASFVRSKSNNKPWNPTFLKPMRRSSSSSGTATTLVVEESSRKVGCWACVSSTNRLEPFDGK